MLRLGSRRDQLREWREGQISFKGHVEGMSRGRLSGFTHAGYGAAVEDAEAVLGRGG